MIAFDWKCPRCNALVAYPEKTCSDCGQPLNWSLDPSTLRVRNIKRILSLFFMMFLMGAYVGIMGAVFL